MVEDVEGPVSRTKVLLLTWLKLAYFSILVKGRLCAN